MHCADIRIEWIDVACLTDGDHVVAFPCRLDDVLKASARKYARLAIADYALREMWAPFSEPVIYSPFAADPMRALTHVDEDSTGSVYGMA